MKTADANSLTLSLIAMTVSNADWISAREKDLAEYALFKIHQENFRMDCLDPCTKAIIKMAFMTKEERRAILAKGQNMC